MEFKASMFAIIIASMVIIASGIIISEWSVPYESGIVSDLQDFDKLSESSETAEAQKGYINPQSGEASSDYEQETFRGGYGIITGFFSPLRVVFGEGGMIDAITDRFGIPNFVRQGIVTLILTAITALIVSIIFRRSKDQV